MDEEKPDLLELALLLSLQEDCRVVLPPILIRLNNIMERHGQKWQIWAQLVLMQCVQEVQRLHLRLEELLHRRQMLPKNGLIRRMQL